MIDYNNKQFCEDKEWIYIDNKYEKIITAAIDEPFELRELLYNALLSYEISSIEQLNEITEDQEDFLLSTAKQSVKSHYNDIIDLASMMNNLTRENSHGAATLSKVFVHRDKYNKILGKHRLKPGTTCKMHNIIICGSDLKNSYIIGVCKPKFAGVSAENLVILGQM